MFSDSKVAQLETKLDIYEELSREMLAKLETAVDKIQDEIKSFSKFRWQIGGVLLVGALLIGAGSRLAPIFLTPEPQQVIIQGQK